MVNLRFRYMKKVFFAIIAILVSGAAVSAGDKQFAGSYRSSILDKESYVYSDASKAYVWVSGGKKVDRIQFVISRYAIGEFNAALESAGVQFAQYCASDGSAAVPVSADFPAITVRWRGTSWNTVRKHFPYPYLTRTPDGTPVLLFAGKLRKGRSEKEYVLVFSSLDEIGEFTTLLSKLKK